MHPVLIRIGNLPIGTYGVAIVVGLLAGLGLVSHLARRRNLQVDFFWDLAFVLLISGFLGARLLFILLNWAEFLDHPASLIFSRQGFVFLGGFFSALLVGIWFTLHRRMPLLDAADLLAPGLVLAHAIGRIGCFFAGCCYGRICETGHGHPFLEALAIRFPLVTDPAGLADPMFNFAWRAQHDAGLLAADATSTLPIVPIQLFESAGNFLICLALVWLWRRRLFSGQIFALYLMLYSAQRFGLEFLRGDTDRGLWLGGALSTSQILSCVTLTVALWLWWTRRNMGVQVIPQAVVAESPAQPSSPPAAGPSETLAKSRRRRGARKSARPTSH